MVIQVFGSFNAKSLISTIIAQNTNLPVWCIWSTFRIFDFKNSQFVKFGFTHGFPRSPVFIHLQKEKDIGIQQKYVCNCITISILQKNVFSMVCIEHEHDLPIYLGPIIYSLNIGILQAENKRYSFHLGYCTNV